MEWNKPSAADQVDYDPVDVFRAGLRHHHLANTAYPIRHTMTMQPYRVRRAAVQAVATAAWEGIDALSLYVHVPFCERRCSYCEYTVLDSHDEEAERRYFDLLMKEFALWREAVDTASKRLVGFDIGGGTPALVQVAQIARTIDAATLSFRFPDGLSISIETTPKIAAAEPDKIASLHSLGIDRISMGIQTINPHLLREFGRPNGAVATNRRAAAHIRQAGFDRFNVDLMYGFARQSQASWEATLRHAIGLEPEYVTLYRMRYKGTRIAGQSDQVSLAQVNAQYQLAAEILAAAGYRGTPGKNTFSRLAGDPGTSAYLTERVVHGEPYLGLGLGAQSMSEQTLAYNQGAASKTWGLYERDIRAGRRPIQDLYHLSRPAAMAKMIAVSFYFGEIHRASFRRKFGIDLAEAFPAEVAFLMEHDLMAWTPETFRLTKAGVDQVSGTIALFYAPAVKGYLIGLGADDV